ncbi:MAG: elongation factor Ts [Parcubacteria group bacterium]|nr:MAG: elongation factor Ts [Parcubacteria group bacterium]
MSLELIKEIRQITGAGMVDVKQALDEAGGDKDKAVEILRKSGSKIAAKKSERQVKEGVIALARGADKLAVVELACETDFVARNEDFIATVDSLAQKLLADGQGDFESWANDQIKNDLIVKIGENLRLGKFNLISGDIIGAYLHSNKKVAGVAVLAKGSVELAKDIAMQIAAAAPKYLGPGDVPQDVVTKEQEIYREQLKNEGKPENMWDKILPGKLQKFYSEVCLLKQVYIKDDKKTIETLLKESGAEIKEFYYYSL